MSKFIQSLKSQKRKNSLEYWAAGIKGRDNVEKKEVETLQKQKSPQVVKDLTGGIQIISDTNISQKTIIELVFDADLATKDIQCQRLRSFFEIGDFVLK